MKKRERREAGKLTFYLRRGQAGGQARVVAVLGWSLIAFVLLFKLTFLYVTGLGPPYAGRSFLFLRPPELGYWAMDWHTADPLVTPAYQAITGALAEGRGLALPFAIPLTAASLLLSILLPVTGFLLVHLHHFGQRVKWWHPALAGLVILSLTCQTAAVRVFTVPQGRAPSSEWSRLISRAARQTGANPALLAAVLEQESGGRARAVSRDSLGNPVAYGLMQLIPATAARFGLPQQRILDPAENILAGAKYIALLNHDFDGHTGLVLAGYYAGEHAVQTALARAGLSPGTWSDRDWPEIAGYLPGVSPGQPSVEQYVREVEQKLARIPPVVPAGPSCLAD